ncbi:ubiquitin-conjugating enzyme E2 R2 [Xyrichtys novacula]|uniref:Ubiquitin-conjugating enzyme E2 R2 n=1 Tax=Xyrichtys novacula TaxID=13765 RepID=A0AAV1ES41_XYRNO|nr:ubiquitin-conjugating enzyme E2 R2 [Xyrichtys novacula]
MKLNKDSEKPAQSFSFRQRRELTLEYPCFTFSVCVFVCCPPTIRTILLSVISLLNEPNTFSPANVDASVMFRKWRDSKGKDKEYAEIIRKQVLSTAAEAERDGVKVPTTLAEYCVQTRVPSQDSSSDLLYDDLYDDDMEEEDEDEDESELESVGEAGGVSSMEGGGTSTRRYDNQDDSGNEDS